MVEEGGISQKLVKGERSIRAGSGGYWGPEIV